MNNEQNNIGKTNAEEITDLKQRVDTLERTLEGMQVLLGKASEYRARPRRERYLPR